MNRSELNSILEGHQLWLSGDDGERANLEDANLWGADLRGADLRGADLGGANLGGANLRGANLGGADLRGADLRGADLRGADLLGANLLGANLGGANLWGANLGGANLGGADLRGADLRGATGNMKEIKSLFIEQYPVVYTSEYLQIGCERHPVSDWRDFPDDRIIEMDGKDALKFWRKWKDYIFNTIEMSPASDLEATQ